MSEPTNPSQGPASFEDQMELLTQELELAIRWQRPCMMMVAYGSEYVRADSVSMLENYLMDRGLKIVWIHAGDAIVNSLEFWYRILDGANHAAFFLDGLTDLAQQSGFKAILNQHAYLFAEKNARLVFWLTFKEASAIAYQAPLLWTGRNRLIELTAPPKPEQILQNALESVWQGTGEYDDQFDDTEAKISLRESFITELPKNNESSSMRANLLVTLGILNWRKGDHEKANEMLQNALKIAAKMQDNWFEAECFNAVALVKSSQGKYEEAIDAYKQAIQLAPNQIFAWNNLGNLCLKINRNHEAMIAFQKAIEHNPTDAIAWNGLGDVYARSEYVDDAIAAYRKSIEVAPSLPHPWNGLGDIYARSGRPIEAVTAFQKAIKLNGYFMLPWLGLAHLYTRQERYRDASKAYQQALLLDPRNSPVWNELGCLYLEAGRYEDAIESLAKAIELDRGFGWAYSNLALAHAKYEKQLESIPLYLKSLELLHNQEQRSLTWNRLADAYRSLNDYENAVRAYQMADSLSTKLLPTNENASDGTQASALADTTCSPLTSRQGQIQGTSALDADSDHAQSKPASVPEAESALETEANRPVARSDETSVETVTLQPESDPEKEPPFWIFQAAGLPEEMPAQHFPAASMAAGSGQGNAGTKPETAVQEIGGLSMQMSLPFLARTVATDPALFRPEDLFEVDSPRVDPTSARVWNEKGNLLFRAGSYEAAIRVYNRAIQLDRSFGWSYCNLGITYLHLGRYAEAILLLQKSLELLTTDQDRAIAWNELGNLYRHLNDYHNAVVAYQKADELDPDHAGVRDTVEYLHAEPSSGNAQVWNELGDTFFRACSYREASDCYRKTVEMDPLNGMAHSNLALSLTYQSRFAEAVPLYLKSIELFHDDKEKADVWNRLGNVYRRLDDYDKAIAAYKNAVKLNNEAMTLLTRARFSLLGNCNVD